MICLIQRVTQGQVEVENSIIGSIETGLVVLVGFQPDDDHSILEKMAHKLLHYRIFADDQQRMNLNVQQVNAGILLVPQFTLAADTKSGLRPSFSSAAQPDMATDLFDQFCKLISERYQNVAFGEFGAEMQVSLINDGPVTFWLEI
jgi:D-tyrosyl-tRNA(Tyr) deacylase